MNLIIMPIRAAGNTCYVYRYKEIKGSDWWSEWGIEEKYNACIGQVEAAYETAHIHPVPLITVLVVSLGTITYILMVSVIKLIDREFKYTY